MKKYGFHFIFWAFIALYDFDYLIDKFTLLSAMGYTIFEISVYATEFYVHLFLLKEVLSNKGKIAYTVGLITLLIAFCLIYFLSGLSEILLSPIYTRAVYTFFLNHLLYIFISYLVWYFYKFEHEAQQRLLVENEKLHSEMMLLKSQISPHFLFNALNNIYTLTLLKHEDAPKMLATLSDILRYFIYKGGDKFVFLTAEIEAISKYILIQKYRQLPGAKNIQFSIEGNTADIKIPPLLLITLIENAFKHGDIMEEETGFVQISLSIIKKEIHFQVVNSYTAQEGSDGIGLKNLAAQLKILYGKNYNLQVETTPHFNVKLSIHGNEKNI